MADTNTKATPKKAATKPIVASTKPAATKPAVAAKVTGAKPAAVSAKPAVKEPVVVKKPASATTAEAKPAAKTSSPSKIMTVSDEQRYRMVAEAAYYYAERNQFKSDHVRDWIDAERDIAALLGSGK